MNTTTVLVWKEASKEIPAQCFSRTGRGYAESEDVLVILETGSIKIAYIYFGAYEPAWISSDDSEELSGVKFWAYLRDLPGDANG